MPRQFKVISNTNKNETHTYKFITPAEKHKHFKAVTNTILQDAEDIWADIWNEFQGSVTQGVILSPEAEKGHFIPKCGWPEFLEKMWQLKHYLDCAKRFCEVKE